MTADPFAIQPSAAWGVPKPPPGWIAHGTRSAWCWMPEGWIYGAIQINISVPNPVTTDEQSELI